MPARYVYVEHSYIGRNLLEFKWFLQIFQTANSHLGIIDVVFNLFLFCILWQAFILVCYLQLFLWNFHFFNLSFSSILCYPLLKVSISLIPFIWRQSFTWIHAKKIGNNIYFNQFLKWLYFCCWNCGNVSDRIRSLSNIQQH